MPDNALEYTKRENIGNYINMDEFIATHRNENQEIDDL